MTYNVCLRMKPVRGRMLLPNAEWPAISTVLISRNRVRNPITQSKPHLTALEKHWRSQGDECTERIRDGFHACWTRRHSHWHVVYSAEKKLPDKIL